MSKFLIAVKKFSYIPKNNSMYEKLIAGRIKASDKGNEIKNNDKNESKTNSVLKTVIDIEVIAAQTIPMNTHKKPLKLNLLLKLRFANTKRLIIEIKQNTYLLIIGSFLQKIAINGENVKMPVMPPKAIGNNVIIDFLKLLTIFPTE